MASTTVGRYGGSDELLELKARGDAVLRELWDITNTAKRHVRSLRFAAEPEEPLPAVKPR